MSTNSFKVAGVIRKSCNLKLSIAFNNKLFFRDNFGNLYVYNIRLSHKSLQSRIDSTFICNFNPSKPPHLYKKPYFLPCGKYSACLDCIDKNFNFYSGTIKCNFESCKLLHKFNQQLVRDVRLDEKIGIYSASILKSMFTSGDYLVGCLGNEGSNQELFERKFNIIENEIEQRIQVLNQNLENLKEKFMKKIDFLEKQIRNPNLKFKLSKKKFNLEKIGRVEMNFGCLKTFSINAKDVISNFEDEEKFFISFF